MVSTKYIIVTIFIIFLILNINERNIENFKNNYEVTIIHYCIGSYDIGDYGGVARYDYHLKKCFPNRKFFKAPEDKNKMLDFMKTLPNPVIITDNHLCLDIPKNNPLIIVHHGIAKTHKERDSKWQGPLADLCIQGQKKMFYYRNPKNTSVISISQFCTDEFTRHLKDQYQKFDRELILHTSELDTSRYKKKFNLKPIILGNWNSPNKGQHIYINLSRNHNFFTFQNLYVKNDNNDIDDFNKRKQDIYLNSDIFLQLSSCEGNSYATIDAILNGLVLVASNVGLCYQDLPEDCFVKIDWHQNNDEEYVLKKLQYAWENKEILSKKCRKWFLENCEFKSWEYKMRQNINNFVKKNYQ